MHIIITRLAARTEGRHVIFSSWYGCVRALLATCMRVGVQPQLRSMLHNILPRDYARVQF